VLELLFTGVLIATALAAGWFAVRLVYALVKGRV